jgi:prevent-host-death family protein
MLDNILSILSLFVLVRGRIMPKTVSATEAKSRFGAMVKWAVENQDDVIVRQYGDPTAVLISYAEYERLVAWREQERRNEAFEQLEAIRRRIQEATPTTDVAEAYRQAGMAEWVIRETLEADAALERGETP